MQTTWIPNTRYSLHRIEYTHDDIVFAGMTALPRAHFGQGIGPILFGNVSCAGIESTLLDCGYSNITTTESHSEDAGVRCLPC